MYPLATAPRPGLNAQTKGKFGLTLHLKSEVPIQELKSPSHPDDFVIVRHADAYYEASLETDGGDLNRDVVLACHVSRPRTGVDLITTKQSGEDGYFLLTLTAGEELAAASSGMDYVFVLDISGSMTQDGKLRISRDSIDAFIRELGPEDRFELITFNVSPTTLFNQLVPISEQKQAEAVQFLRAQQGRGGTVLRPAIATAYKYGDPDRPLNVVILSDGMTEPSERQELLALIKARPANARVFCIGVGNEVNRPLLSQLSEDAGGLAAFLSQGDDFGRQAQAFRRKLLRPAAANVRLKIEGAEVYDLEPKQLPNLYHGMPVRLYGRYRNNGPAKVRMEAEINGAPLEQAIAVEFPANNPANPEIERMWAWKKVDRLLREADRTQSRTAVVDEIVRLGEGYSIVSEYTSFLVLENDAEYKRWQIARRNVLRVAQDREQQQRVRAELGRLREKALADLGPPVSSSGQDTVLPTASRSPTPLADASPTSPAPLGPDVSDSPNQRGGGAFDPLTAGIALALAGLGYAARRRQTGAA